jgi:hypothetical protein
MIDARQMYVEPQMLDSLQTSLATTSNAEEADRAWIDFFHQHFPTDFLALPDNPWRSLVSEVMKEMKIEKHQCFKNFFEFHLAEALPRALHLRRKEWRAYETPCAAHLPEFSCSSLSQLKKKARKALRLPEMQKIIDALEELDDVQEVFHNAAL